MHLRQLEAVDPAAGSAAVHRGAAGGRTFLRVGAAEAGGERLGEGGSGLRGRTKALRTQSGPGVRLRPGPARLYVCIAGQSGSGAERDSGRPFPSSVPAEQTPSWWNMHGMHCQPDAQRARES